MRKDVLLLTDGTKCNGVLVDNDMLTDLVWKCGDRYVFESEVEGIVNKITPLINKKNRLTKQEHKVSFSLFD